MSFLFSLMIRDAAADREVDQRRRRLLGVDTPSTSRPASATGIFGGTKATGIWMSGSLRHGRDLLPAGRERARRQTGVALVPPVAAVVGDAEQRRGDRRAPRRRRPAPTIGGLLGRGPGVGPRLEVGRDDRDRAGLDLDADRHVLAGRQVVGLEDAGVTRHLGRLGAGAVRLHGAGEALSAPWYGPSGTLGLDAHLVNAGFPSR